MPKLLDLDPPVPKAQTSDPKSFGYSTVQSRWPSILTGIIDDVHRAVSCLDTTTESEKIDEGKQLVALIAAYKYEIQHSRKVTPIPDDGEPDVELYNDELAEREELYGVSSGDDTGGKEVKWHAIEWLYGECYLYRRLAAMFRMTRHWKSYDCFQKQKMSTFKSSRPAVLELAAKYREIIEQVRRSDKDAVVGGTEDPAKIAEAEKVLFMEMAEVCLWGNATDLSLLTNVTYEDIQKLQGSNARKESEKNILVNDLQKVFAILNQAKKDGKKQRRVDIVLDNAGFELFVDLILSGYLLATGLATEVVLHPKNIPWFVSDVIPKDFQDLLGAMNDPKAFYEKADEDGKEHGALSENEVSDIQFMFEHWSELHGEGQLMMRPNVFWTYAGGYWRLPTLAPKLLEDLQESEVVIFKGDLNYRKLIGDGEWDPATPFVEAIGPMAKGSGVRILALRTCKADCVVGLPPGKDEELKGMDGGGGDSGARKWAWSGKWAVVQFSDGKS